jgi:predicted NBD/HSP70 family sugar kinase
MRALPLAEARFGGRGSVPTLLHVFVGNVVGAAVLVDGKPLLGTSSAAGYIDHLPTRVRSQRRCTCGRNDCLAATASDVVLVEDARARGLLGHDEGLDELLALATAGNRVADRLLRRRAELAGGAIALLVDTLDPHVVILGGGLVDDPRYLPDIRAAVAGAVRRPLAVPAEQLVHATSFGPHAVMFSSAALYLDTFYRDPAGHLALTRS